MSYYVQLSYNAYVSLVVYLLFHEGKQKFLQTVLVQEDEDETVTRLRETEMYLLYCSSLCKASVKQTHQKAAE